MRWHNKVKISLIIAIIGYFFGNLIPIKFLKPNINNTGIEYADYLIIIISSISALVTFLAVLIALFKEDIRKWWKYSKIEVSIPNESFTEILKTNIDSSNQSLEAMKYDCKIIIYNSGNISAMGLEIQMESLIYNGVDFPTAQTIESFGHSIYWDKKNETKITLPPEGKKSISILELTAPEQQSSPEGEKISIPSILKIANLENPNDYKHGKWTASFAIFSTNAKPIRFVLEIDWNGKWENRITEMKNHLKIELKK